MTDDNAPGWRPIESMPWNRQVLVSDGAIVKPATRVGPDVVVAPIPMRLGMWTHWAPFPAPPPPERGA